MLNSWETISPASAAGFASNFADGGFDDPHAFHRGLQKALSSGTTIDTDLTDGPATSIVALRLEDLSSILTMLTHSQKHMVLWRWLKKKGAFNITYQYNRQDTYGEEEASAYYLEGGKPIAQDDEYTRFTREIKFLGVEREITLAAMLQKTGGGVPDIKSRTTQTGTLHLLQKLERAMFYGRAELDTTNLAFDGIEEQINANSPSTHVIDCLGGILTPSLLDDGIKLMADNYSNLNDINTFMSHAAVTNFSKPYRDDSRERIELNAAKDGIIVAGNAVNGYKSNFGYMPFTPSVFMGKFREEMKISDFTAAKGGDNAPNPITAASITVTVETDTTSNMAAGTYWYSVTAKNRFGTSTPVHTASGTLLTTNQKATIAWTAPALTPAGGVPVAYYLWRHTANPATAANQSDVKLMREVTADGVLSYADTNQNRPGEGVVFLLDGEEANLCAVQLSPLMRFPLATVTTAYRYLLLLFIDVVVRNPNKQIMFKNVGSSTS